MKISTTKATPRKKGIEMKKMILCFLISGLAACSQAQAVDGTYERVSQTTFEKQHGMSVALVVTDNGRYAVMKNGWGDTPLLIADEEGSKVVQQNGVSLYRFELGQAGELTLIDIDNPTQKFHFQKGGNK